LTIITDDLPCAIAEMDEEKVMKLVKESMLQRYAPLEIVQSLQAGMAEVGNRFQSGDYYLSELIYCGEIMKEAMKVLEPSLRDSREKYIGTIIIGTVKGDIHDLGKNVVIMLLKGVGYKVVDLGVDVAHEKIIEAVKEYNSPLVALSVLLTSCIESVKTAVSEVKKAGIGAKVMIGGPFIDEQTKNYCAADFGSDSAGDAVKFAAEIFVV